MKSLGLVAVFSLLASPAFAVSQDRATADAGAQAAAAKTAVIKTASNDSDREDKRICKTIQVTGSRLGATSVCKTRKEWDDQAALYRKTLERQQLNPSKILSPVQ